ncbi:unnamed protein product [Leptidea sinapis]|uniref:Major facilitator superfamily (MFS) profile domain-containing protein n=1 Tax=Leptidea sinapis TaxID=189913 RepID=A0A5E4QCS4_9NEOP|nr:unnamed protein product [Leptidea sinapis]
MMETPTMHMLSVQEKGGETRRTNQYIAAIAAAIGAVVAGTILAWTSPALPQLEPPKNNSLIKPLDVFLDNSTSNETVLINSLGDPADFLLNTKESSLVSSTLAIGAAISALPVGVFAQKFGRRPTVLILAGPFMVNWLLTIFANGPGMLIAARFFAGLATDFHSRFTRCLLPAVPDRGDSLYLCDRRVDALEDFVHHICSIACAFGCCVLVDARNPTVSFR